jgi:hypothetical protein
MYYGTINFNLMESEIQFREINFGVCFVRANQAGLPSIYIKSDAQTAIGVNLDATLHNFGAEELIKVVWILDVTNPDLWR